MAIIVVALHGLLLLIAWCLGEQVYRRSVSDDASMTWILTASTRTACTVRRFAARSTLATIERTSNRGGEHTRADTTVDSPARSPRQIDWGAHAAFNARRAVEDGTGERYRNLGPRKPGPPPEPAIPSIFEPEPDVRGEEGLDVNGDPVVRLNKYCYQELEKRLPTARDYVDPDKTAHSQMHVPHRQSRTTRRSVRAPETRSSVAGTEERCDGRDARTQTREREPIKQNRRTSPSGGCFV